MMDLIQKLEISDRTLVARDRASKATTIINWTQAERDKLRNIAAGAWKDFSKTSPLAKKAYESHMAFMKKMALLD